jgi:hypothetical protein
MSLPANLEPCTTEKLCDDNDVTIFPMMVHFIEVEKMSERGAGDAVSVKYPKGKVSPERARKIYYDRKGGTDVPVEKPLRKQTVPEVKKQLVKVVKEIKSAKVSDDDIKKLDIVIATAITEGTSAVRVGTATATAVKNATKKKGGVEPKPIDNFKKLNNHMKAAIDGLTLFAEGTMEPETEDEAEYAKAILAKAANFIIQYARLGADIEGILNTFVEGETNDSNEKYNRLRKIN